MTDKDGGGGAAGTVPRVGETSASITLSVQTIDEEVRYALRGVPIVGGPCDGRPDGTSCGAGCVCKGNEPWFTTDALAAMHIDVKRGP